MYTTTLFFLVQTLISATYTYIFLFNLTHRGNGIVSKLKIKKKLFKNKKILKTIQPDRQWCDADAVLYSVNNVVDALTVVPIHIESFCAPVHQQRNRQRWHADNYCRIDLSFYDADDDDGDYGYYYYDVTLKPMDHCFHFGCILYLNGDYWKNNKK